MQVHILVNGNSKMSKLVFETLHIGFPTWPKILHKEDRGCHWKWIREIVEVSNEPFILCDTDIIFFDSVEELFDTSAAMCGEYFPMFYDPITKLLQMPRLHTALMMIDPVALKELEAKHQQPTNAIAKPDFISPTYAWPMYYDTLANAFGALRTRCKQFIPADRYVHLFCGTWIHEIKDNLFCENLKVAHKKLIEAPTKYSAAMFRAELVSFFFKDASYNWKTD